MKKSDVIETLFKDQMYPTYINTTGEKFPYDKYWNEIANYDQIEIFLANIKAENGEKLTEKIKRMLLVTGWVVLKNKINFVKEKFEIE